jgi:sugar phosphate isomerase/epimerase
MKYALCNELFGALSLEESCTLASRYGFKGMELAPYTLAETPRLLGPEKRREIGKIISDSGMAFVGLHWLLKAPEGLHLTTPDTEIREQSWDLMKYLIEFCAELGGGVMVLGSGQNRNTVGIPAEKAVSYLKEGLTTLAPFAKMGDTKILLEPLTDKMTNVMNTLQEVRDLVCDIDHPAINSMFDFHNSIDETSSWPDLIDRFIDIIQHVHLNEVDGGYPGSGRSDFFPAFQALKRNHYSGWISIEVFDQRASPETILRETRHVTGKIEERLKENRSSKGVEK